MSKSIEGSPAGSEQVNEQSSQVQSLEDMPSFEEHMAELEGTPSLTPDLTPDSVPDQPPDPIPDLTPEQPIPKNGMESVDPNAEVTQEQNDAANLGNEGYVLEGDAAQEKAREAGLRPGENNYSDDEKEAKIASGEF